MITTHTFLDKSNCIFSGSNANLGLNPILELHYGALLSRCILHFDTSKVEGRVDDKTYPDITKLRHVLRLANPAGLTGRRVNCAFPDGSLRRERERAASFDIILFLVDREWDAGKGFDYVEEYDPRHRSCYTEDGSNWYNAKTGTAWEAPGIFSSDRLADELEAYEMGTDSIIIAKVHFDYGIEQMAADITPTVNAFIDGTLTNYGIGMAFTPSLESTSRVVSQYAGFFSPHTHSFFEPYLETTYDDIVSDDRSSFHTGESNRLYFYSSHGTNPVNLDAIPSCSVDGTTYPVTQATKGAYYIEIPAYSETSTDALEPDVMHYDTWSYTLNGVTKSRELYFTPYPADAWLTMGIPYETQPHPRVTPSLYGIKNRERIVQGDIRTVRCDLRIDYSTDSLRDPVPLYYRVYVLMGDKEVDVYRWRCMDRYYNGSMFQVDTSEMVPSQYYVDVKTCYGGEEIVTKNVLTFEVVEMTRDRYVGDTSNIL